MNTLGTAYMILCIVLDIEYQTNVITHLSSTDKLAFHIGLESL